MNNAPKIIWICLASFFVGGCSARQDQSNIPYPEVPAEDSIVSYMPGVVSSAGDSIDFNASFSPDGKAFFFTRSFNRKWDIYVSTFNGTQWLKAIKTSFSTSSFSEADPAFGPDGYLYYISNQPKDDRDTIPDFDIWRIKPLPDSRWTQPENVTALNSDSTEYYISFASDSSAYFASSRQGGYGLEDIYVSRLSRGSYTPPVNLGPAINSVYSDHDACLSQDHSFMVYTSVDRPGGSGEGDLYLSIKNSYGQWTTGVNLGKGFNSNTYEYCSYFSPDYKFFFYSSKRDIKWMHTATLEKAVRRLRQRIRQSDVSKYGVR